MFVPLAWKWVSDDSLARKTGFGKQRILSCVDRQAIGIQPRHAKTCGSKEPAHAYAAFGAARSFWQRVL